MLRPPFYKRAGKFVWGILPREPAHALLFLGAVCIFISPELRWWDKTPGLVWYHALRLMLYIFFVAGAGGYYLCFLPTQRPVRRLIECVLLPTFVGLAGIPAVALLCFRNVIFAPQSAETSVLATGSSNVHAFLDAIRNFGTGYEFAALGFAFVLWFTIQLPFGRTTLPARLLTSPAGPIPDEVSEPEHRRTMAFVWMMVGLIFLTNLPGEIYWRILRSTGWAGHHPSSSLWAGYLSDLVFQASLLAFILSAIGADGRQMLRSKFRLPRAKYLGLAAALALPVLGYMQARLQWRQCCWGQSPPPTIGDFVSWPGIAAVWLFVPALIEEIAWRGYLQPRFIRRYGLARGVFFVGVVWGAFHFAWDSHWQASLPTVMKSVQTRVLGTVILSYALAWLTIWSKSILPAAVAHATFNALLAVDTSKFDRHYDWWVTIAVWLVAGYLLFHLFPPPRDEAVDEVVSVRPETAPEAATSEL
jgi:membrane protease YdiL (CAAX protease family)